MANKNQVTKGLKIDTYNEHAHKMWRETVFIQTDRQLLMVTELINYACTDSNRQLVIVIELINYTSAAVTPTSHAPRATPTDSHTFLVTPTPLYPGGVVINPQATPSY